jgi:hypothetical protein
MCILHHKLLDQQTKDGMGGKLSMKANINIKIKINKLN